MLATNPAEHETTGAEMDIFSNPASDWMIRHATQVQPAVLQLQQQADKIHYNIISHNGRGKTVIGQALDIMQWQQAQTMDQVGTCTTRW